MTIDAIKETYRTSMQGSTAYDEMFSDDLQVRKHYELLAQVLHDLPTSTIGKRADQMARTFLDRGVTFDYAGEERPFPLDIVPRIIPEDE